MMGGYGSGKWNRWNTKTLVSDCLSLDARRLQQEGLLKSEGLPDTGTAIGWTWLDDSGDSRSTIGIQLGVDQVTLRYRFGSGEGENQDITELVPLDWTPCNYGGRRA